MSNDKPQPTRPIAPPPRKEKSSPIIPQPSKPQSPKK